MIQFFFAQRHGRLMLCMIKAYKDVQRKLNEKLTAASIIERTSAMSFQDNQALPCNIGLDDFDFLKVLGKGTFGKVRRATWWAVTHAGR